MKERTKELEKKNVELEKATIILKKSQDSLALLLEDVNKTKLELEGKNADLEQFNKLFINREFRIKELRERVKKMEGETVDSDQFSGKKKKLSE